MKVMNKDEIKRILDESGKKYICVITYEKERKGTQSSIQTEIINNFDTAVDPFDVVKFIVLNLQMAVNNYSTMMTQGLPIPVDNKPPQLDTKKKVNQIESQYR